MWDDDDDEDDDNDANDAEKGIDERCESNDDNKNDSSGIND